MVSKPEWGPDICLFTKKLPLHGTQIIFNVISYTCSSPYDKTVFENVFDDIRELSSSFILILRWHYSIFCDSVGNYNKKNKKVHSN